MFQPIAFIAQNFVQHGQFAKSQIRLKSAGRSLGKSTHYPTLPWRLNRRIHAAPVVTCARVLSSNVCRKLSLLKLTFTRTYKNTESSSRYMHRRSTASYLRQAAHFEEGRLPRLHVRVDPLQHSDSGRDGLLSGATQTHVSRPVAAQDPVPGLRVSGNGGTAGVSSRPACQTANDTPRLTRVSARFAGLLSPFFGNVLIFFPLLIQRR